MNRRLFFLTVAFITSIMSYSQYITVNNTYTNTALVNDVFLSGTCTDVSGIKISGHTFSDGMKSWGYFSKGQSNFPFDKGIVLTTGRLSGAPGPNDGIRSDGPASWKGDQDLETAVNINNTFNATTLEFNFIPDASTMRFEYIFASEQYLKTGNLSQCGYTDGFAFILKDVTNNGVAQNLALVPQTATPVTSNTIRGAGGLCPPANAQYFASFNDFDSPISYNGNTVPLMVETDVIPGHTYHLKIVIADQGNQLYDSAVFLRANSFDASISLGEDRLVSTFNALCANKTLDLNATVVNALSYKWYRNDQVINGATNAIYTVTQPGTYKVEITKKSGCITTGQIVIEYDNFSYESSVTLKTCGIKGIANATFNLNDATAQITQSPFEEIFYYKNYNNGNPTDVIVDINNFQAADNTVVYAVIQSENGCIYNATVILNVNYSELDVLNYGICDSDNNQDGLTLIPFDPITQQILQFNNLGSQTKVTYYLTTNDVLTNQNALGSSFTNTVPNQQTIYAKIVFSNGNCYKIISINISVFTATLHPKKEIKLCKGDTVAIAAVGESDAYTWSNGAKTRAINVSEGGLYTVTYSTKDGCQVTEQFAIIISDGPTDVKITVNDFAATNNSITVHASGNGDYEYSIDGKNFQKNAVFSNLAPGAYTVYIRDRNGCGTYQEIVYLLDYPRFFSPNGDGYNDKWRIENLSWIDSKAIVRIYDRYGKLLFEFSSQFYWDGTHNNRPMPANDYWFTVTFANKKEIKGHFSLIR